MKTFKKLSIIFIILAAIMGGLGLGFLIDALFVGYTDPNGMIYGIVSAVAFVICIGLIVSIICFNIIGTQKDINKKETQRLIILPSKKNISFDPRDVDLFTIIKKENVEDDFPCLIEADLHACATCKAKSLQSELNQLKQNQIKNKKKHASNISKFENLISGVSKDTNLIILKQKQKGKVFVPSAFVEWPVEEVIVDIVENDTAFENVYEEMATEDVVLKILNSKDDIVNVNAIVETFETTEIPMEEEIIPYCDEEIVYIQGPVFEDNNECVENESITIHEENVDENNDLVDIQEQVFEDENNEYIDNELVNIQGPVVEELIIGKITTSMEDSIVSINEDETGLLEHNSQYVEWPVQRLNKSNEVDSNKISDEIFVEKEAVVEEKPTNVEEVKTIVEQKAPSQESKISIKEINHEKEFIVEAEDLFENEEFIGDDSRVFNDHEELEAVAMTLKSTITNSLFTGKQNVVFVKRPPVRLFTKIYIIDRSTESFIGEATVRVYERGLKKQIWSKYGKNSTITKDQYDTYYSSSLLACALVIKTVSKYKEPAPISKYGIQKVPSTFLYFVD